VISSVNRKAFRVVRKTRASEEIIEQVRELIISGGLKPGDRLPAERELAQTLGVGRSTVREAIRSMESLGMVQTRPGEGTFLGDGMGNQAHGPFAASLFQFWHGQRKLFEVRRVIEPDLAAFAGLRATPEQISRMREALDRQEAAIATGGNGFGADTEFHFRLAEAAGNEVLLQIMNSLMDMLRETREASLMSGDRASRSLRNHRAILRAIERGDPEGAEQRMYEHLEEMEQFVFSSGEKLQAMAQSAAGAPGAGVGA
jgi:GntR family transcriptional repressor for pyruvate dehydrogenase complex